MTTLPFEIGFDHYRYGLPLAKCRFKAQHEKDLQDGFEAARIQGVTPKKPDLFEKKLLTIKDRSLVKNLEVTITVQDLKNALKEVGNVCPITRRRFTFAENKDTDWSVDRIDNNRGYRPGNITIISRLANEAKDNLDLASITKEYFQPSMTSTMLTNDEWLRMANFYYHRLTLLKTFSFCQLVADDETIIDLIIGSGMLMFLLHKDKHAKALLTALAKYTSRDSVCRATKLIKKRYYKRDLYDEGLMLDSPKLAEYLSTFRQIAISNNAEFDPLLLSCLFERTHG
jgi:hypothetical protein